MKFTAFFLSFLLGACANTGFTGSGAGASAQKNPKDSTNPDGTKDGGNKDADQSADATKAKGSGGSDGEELGKNDVVKDDDEEIAEDVDLPLNFQAFQGEASNTNCVSIQAVNDQAAVEMGCNLGPNQFAAKTLKAKAKPYCNVIRIINKNVSINATISTQNAAQVRWGQGQGLANYLGIKLFPVTAGTIEGQLNDNGDDKDDIDVRFQVSGLDTVTYTIENSNQGCTPKAPIP